MNTLIIAEKPSVANRIANALGAGHEKRLGESKVGYYEIKDANGTTYVAAAVGHLFTIKQASKERGYPVLDVEWAPSYTVGTKADYTKAYLDTLEGIAKKCERFINACDFDIEGTVIGTNIIKYLNKNGLKANAQRMKFSTTTTEDLKESYSRLMPLDLQNFYAGEARHMLDWLWGINFSRALTYAVSGPSMKNALSIGRVQGPTLAILAEREIEISKFAPKQFWRLFCLVQDVEFINVRGDMFRKEEAAKAHDETKKNARNGIIESVETKEQHVAPYPPFDLTSLQLEASRALHMDPSLTLAIAQSLYEKAYISYPRTSSQKLPATLGLQKIISSLAKNPGYSSLANALIKEKRFKPHEGAKEDEAHPAIYPTGEMAREMTQQEAKVYDIIARRFLACFADNAAVARAKVVAKFGEEAYSASGSTILKKGWLEFYTYAKIDEKMLPAFEKGANATASKIELKDLMTQPPKRYTKAGLLSELEKKDLGTKATRAQIIDTLFKRNYIEGTSIMVTKFGMSVYEALRENASMIIDASTTRKLEEDMEMITKGKLKEEEVIDEGKKMLLEALAQFDKNKEQITMALRKGLRESSVLGKCPKDGGDLVIRRSKAGKQFVACANYPKCTNTYSLPQNALIVPTGRTCEHCHTPFIKVIRKGRRPFEMDLDPNCITKKEWAKPEQKPEPASETAVKEKADPVEAKARRNRKAKKTAAALEEPLKEKKARKPRAKKAV